MYVNCGFSSQCGCNNDLIEVGICLKRTFMPLMLVVEFWHSSTFGTILGHQSLSS